MAEDLELGGAYKNVRALTCALRESLIEATHTDRGGHEMMSAAEQARAIKVFEHVHSNMFFQSPSLSLSLSLPPSPAAPLSPHSSVYPLADPPPASMSFLSSSLQQVLRTLVALHSLTRAMRAQDIVAVDSSIDESRVRVFTLCPRSSQRATKDTDINSSGAKTCLFLPANQISPPPHACSPHTAATLAHSPTSADFLSQQNPYFLSYSCTFLTD